MVIFFLLGLAWGKLIGVVEVTRHGARTPVFGFDWDKSHWPKGLGELTAEGIRQHYLIGVELRSRYISEHGLIDEVYNSSQIYIRSTNLNRTIVSAESQLMGLFPKGPELSQHSIKVSVPPIESESLEPIIESLGTSSLPFNFAAVPIHVVEFKYDSLLLGYYPRVCPYISKILDQVKKSSEFTNKVKLYEESLKPQVDQIFGRSVEFKDVGKYADVLISQKFHGFPWPEKMTEEIYSQMVNIGAYDLSTFFKGKGAWLASSEFYSNLLNSFQNILNKQTSVKWWIYSAHDTTLIGFLTAIDIFDGVQPPYASSLIFELIEEVGELFVKIKYNDEVKVIPGCKELCPFGWFKEYFEKFILKDVALECSSDVDVNLEKTVQGYLKGEVIGRS